MNHRLSLLEFIVTIALVLGAATATYNWLGNELTGIVSQGFAHLPH